MKPRFHSFMSGFLTCALVFALALSALAITSRMTIEVDPISIQVNGETFQPTDVTGKEVPVFAYQGTTYAPLRALAEAYGLEVGYDQSANMATVTDPEAQSASAPTPDTTAKLDYSDWSDEDEAAYQEFKGKWEVTDIEAGEPSGVWIYTTRTKDVDAYNFAFNEERDWNAFVLRYVQEINEHPGCNYRVNFAGPDSFFFVTMHDGVAY